MYNAGTVSGAATISLVSHDSLQPDASLGGETVNLSGTVQALASASFLEAGGGATISGGGGGYVLDFVRCCRSRSQ